MAEERTPDALRPRVGFHVSAFGSHQVLAGVSAASRCGFEGLEIYADTSHIFAKSPDEFRTILGITKVALAGVHGGGVLTSPEFREGELAEWRRLVEWTGDVGGAYVIFYGGETNGTPGQDLDRAASFLNELGAFAAEHGVMLCYEPDRNCPFATRDRIGALMDVTDPNCVSLSVDTAHLVRMGLDPAMFLLSQKTRLGVVHFRDLRDGAAAAQPGTELAEHPFAEIGQGVVDFEGVVDGLSLVGFRGWIVGVVEHPAAGDAMASAVNAAQYMRDFLRLEF